MTVALLAVAGGGATGALCRYFLSLLIPSASFPFATLSVNVIGCFALGMFSIFTLSMNSSEWLRLFVQVGVLGGFTTFSSFSLETVQLWQDQRLASSGIYLLLSLCLCCAGIIAGIWLGRLIQHS